MELENEIGTIANESERLTILSLERLKEVETWKRKYDELEEAYKLEIGDLKAQLEQFKANNYVRE